MTRITDEMLMAYADGELEANTMAEVGRAIAGDPALARRAALFGATRMQAKGAFADVLEEPVPPALADAIRRASPVQRASWWKGWTLVPIAAATIAAAAVGYVGGVGLGPSAVVGFPTTEVASAAARVATGESVTVAGTDVRVAGTYPTADGYCRVLSVSGGGEAWRAVACSQDGTWRIAMAVADPAAAGTGYMPASDTVAESIDLFLDSEAAGSALDAASEQQAIRSGWTTAGE